MKKKVPFTVKDEGAVDSVFHWKQKYDESVDKWIRLDSTLTKIIRENDALKLELALVKGVSHPQYIVGMHWLASAYHRICAGEPEREVMIDYGYLKERDE